jgi:hypothetical protein
VTGHGITGMTTRTGGAGESGSSSNGVPGLAPDVGGRRSGDGSADGSEWLESDNARSARGVHYNNLSAAAVAELTELVKVRGMQVLQEINARALRFQQQDSGTPGASHRINFGVYLFSEDESVRGTEEPDDDR